MRIFPFLEAPYCIPRNLNILYQCAWNKTIGDHFLTVRSLESNIFRFKTVRWSAIKFLLIYLTDNTFVWIYSCVSTQTWQVWYSLYIGTWNKLYVKSTVEYAIMIQTRTIYTDGQYLFYIKEYFISENIPIMILTVISIYNYNFSMWTEALMSSCRLV